jgi:small GTP-binding protein
MKLPPIDPDATELDLSSRALTSLPVKITTLTNLTSLDLSQNQLTSLPLEIAKLMNLTSLNLGGNQLKSLPIGITKLTNLTRLDLSFNPVTSLPTEITDLRNLTTLDLLGTRLETLPTEITELTNLRRFYLSSNKLSGLPAEIAKLTKLTKLTSFYLIGYELKSELTEITKLTDLTELYLAYNQLKSLPTEITKLTNLTRLNLLNNQLTSLPAEVAKLTNLTSLRLSGNQLMSLPAELTKLTKLTRLDLSNNQLTSLPSEITKLTNLLYLDLRENQLPIAPETLSNPQDVKAIFAALAGLATGERLNEAKLLVVGDGKVGKSSVVERLIHDSFNPTKQTTLGVEINDEMQILQSEVIGKDDPIKLNIWDFGGQEIQHSTHQFFLTTRSLYLLVVDARKGDQLTNIEYWLKLIESFAGDSPIIIVVNQIDQLKGQRPLNLDRKALQEKYNIRDFVEASCFNGDGIAKLRVAIAREAEALKHVRDFWPPEWLAIKRRLKEMSADYIPVERYLEICGEEKLSDEDLRNSLLDMLHVLGTVIRFPGDTQVLNPRWVTQGVYALLTSPELVKAQGQFDLKDAGEILARLPDAALHYPSHTHRRLIEVMKHFELCFEFTDRPGHYLLPRHLHDNELDIPWDDATALKFQYHYDVLPDAVISRFITRMNQYITKQYYWKNGVFLHSGENRAKIKADLVDRKIFIAINGKEQTRRAFLAVIRSTFAEINSNFKIEIKQMIPVPGHPQVLVSYDDLIAHEEMNKPEIVVAQLRKEFSVRELLDGVEDSRIRFEHTFLQKHLKEGMFSFPMSDDFKPQSPVVPQPNNPTGSIVSYALVFVVVLAAIVAAAVALSKWVSVTAGVSTGIIIIGALLVLGVVGAMQLRNDDRLSEENFLKLMIESYKRLPLLKGDR